jgi:NADPH:quinone reductase
MRAIQVREFGGPDVLQLADLPTPKPGPGELLVRIAVAGVNFMDVYHRVGRYGGTLPYVPGAEAAGPVDAVGAGVTEFRVGDRVAGTGVEGAYAEEAIAPADRLLPLPSSVTFEQGAAFSEQGLTAHYLLHDYYSVGRGTTVLIHAAAGGVGQLAVQIAKHAGARVIGTTSSAEKAEIVRAAGADEVVDYVHGDFVAEVRRLTGGKGVDLVLDGVGKSTFPGDLEAVRIRGTVVLYGSSSGPADPFPPNNLQEKSLTLAGGRLPHHTATREELLGRAREILEGIEAGWLKLRIAKEFPLELASEAHRLLESRRSAGKILLTL